MYGRTASELVKEFASGEPGQLNTFDNQLFGQVLAECNANLLHLQPLMRKIQEHENNLKDKRSEEEEMGISEDERTKSEAEKILIQNALKSDQFGALVHHLSMLRNKRCLMAYVYNRAEIIRNFALKVNNVALPEEIEKKLSDAEKEYFKYYSSTLHSYIEEVDLDMTVDMIPPKDPYIKVRVLKEIGKIAVGNQDANVARHAIMFVRRTDAEQYVTQGLMEELTG